VPRLLPRRRRADASAVEALTQLAPPGPAADTATAATTAPAADEPGPVATFRVETEPESDEDRGTTYETKRRDAVRRAVERVGDSRAPLVGLGILVTVGLVALLAAAAEVGPSWLGPVGSGAVATAYSWALAARTGGRPVVFGTLAAVLAVIVLVTDVDELRTGAAVLTSAVSAVLAVMVTVPAPGFLRAARECVLAIAVASIGALAVAGFEPVVDLVRFEYLTLGLAVAGALALVVRLGAGAHGLGRRGVVVVVVGGIVLVAILVYAEVLRRYGATTLTRDLLRVVDWSRDTLGASPRPLEAVLGVPALAYGVHMRARRRQGWWVCAFGVAGTAAVTNALVPPGLAFGEVTLSVVYGLVVGLVIGLLLVRLDLALTGGGSRSKGRRSSRRAERAEAVRPEPPRLRPLM